MSKTSLIPRDHLEEYFDDFTRTFLRSGEPRAVNVEVLSKDMGDQEAAHGRLVSMEYDKRQESLDLELESGDHRMVAPREVWSVEEPDGFVSAVQVVCSDGSREIIQISRAGITRAD
jgi:hypothetical protein